MARAPGSCRPSLCAALDGHDPGSRSLLPVSLLFQGFDHLARHVILIMPGEHGFGLERAAGLDVSLGDDALPLAEQVGHDAYVADRNVLVAVGHLEADLQIVATLEATRLHHAAEANALSRHGLVIGYVGRRIEEHDRLAQRAEYQRNRKGQHAEA